jgi:hypothetical protein
MAGTSPAMTMKRMRIDRSSAVSPAAIRALRIAFKQFVIGAPH